MNFFSTASCPEHCFLFFNVMGNDCSVVFLILIDSGCDLTTLFGYEFRWNCFEAIVWLCKKSQKFGECSLRIGLCAYSV